MPKRESFDHFRIINPEKLVLTVDKLADRVEEDFPSSGLSAVANEVAAVAEGTVKRVEEIRRPRIYLRVMVGILVATALAGPLLFSVLVSFSEEVTNLGDFLEATDAGLHMLLILAGAIIFLVGLENRLRRNEALDALADFRSLSHLLDLHQINKDPGLDRKPAPDPDHRTVQSDEALADYLDYSGDLLSIIGKLAAYYAQHLRDRVVLDAVNEIENLTSSLSSKLWLKILVLREMKRDH